MQIKEHLNKIFYDQANLFIDSIEVKPASEVYWDQGGEIQVFNTLPENLSDQTSNGPSHPQALSNNGFLDVFSHALLSPEEQLIVSSSFESGVNFNVYIVASLEGYLPPEFPYAWPNGRALKVWQGNYTSGKKWNNGEAYGWAGNPKGIVWISDLLEAKAGPLPWGVAHEMGHQMFNVSHTEFYWGKDRYNGLPAKPTGENRNPDFERGLMNSEYIASKISTLIVKWETEQITKYFQPLP